MKKQTSSSTKPRGWINFKALLITHLVISTIIIIWAIIAAIWLSKLPFPERTSPIYMDKQMLDEGQGTFLILAFSTVVGCGILYISQLITSGTLIYYFFYYNPRHNYDESFTPNFMITIGMIIFSICLVVLPFIFGWFLLIPYKYWVKDHFHQTLKSKIVGRRVVWTSVSLFATIGSAAIIPAVLFGSSSHNPARVPTRTTQLNELYTLSENHPNTLVMYFDRTKGLIFNELLEMDYLINKNKSFIAEFPQFTSYVQSISQGSVTNFANPMINGSWYMQPEFKNLDIKNPFYGDNNGSINMDKWFLDSYMNTFSMFSKYGYSNFSLMNPPYYGHTTYQVNANGYELQKDLTNSYKNNDFYPLEFRSNYNNHLTFRVMDATVGIKSEGQWPTTFEKDDLTIIKDFCSSNNDYSVSNCDNKIKNSPYGNNTPTKIDGVIPKANLKVEDRPGSTFLFFQTYTTHEDYSWVSKNELETKDNPAGINYKNVDDGLSTVTDPKPTHFVTAIWWAIQKMKRICNYLKNLPCHDPLRPWVKNQYDNTNIYFISDHGTPINGDDKNVVALNKFLLKEGVMTENQYNYITKTYWNSNIPIAMFNSTIMRKPALYSNPAWNLDNNTPKKFFNQSNLLVDSDLQSLYESDLQKQLYDMEHPYNKASNLDKDYQFNKAYSTIQTLKLKNHLNFNLIMTL